MRILGLCLVLWVFSAGADAAQVVAPDEPPPTYIEGLAAGDALWLRDRDGGLTILDRNHGRRQTRPDAGVLDIVRYQRAMIGLVRSPAMRSDDDATYRVTVRNLETGEALTPSLAAFGLGLVRSGDDWVVLTRRALMRSDGGPWRKQAFKTTSRLFGHAHMFALDDGTIHVGFDYGEWGGGLWRITPGSTVMEEIQRIDGDRICDGPLSTQCDVVTGIAADIQHEDCLLVSLGLNHMIGHGRLLRVCGDQVSTVFEHRNEPAGPGLLSSHSTPLYGVMPRPDGWIAIAEGRMFTSVGGIVEERDLPPLHRIDGLWVGEGDGFLVLPENAEQALKADPVGDYTPLWIPIAD